MKKILEEIRPLVPLIIVGAVSAVCITVAFYIYELATVADWTIAFHHSYFAAIGTGIATLAIAIAAQFGILDFLDALIQPKSK